jgi:hypothetical protein
MSFYGWDSPDIVYLYSVSGKKLQKVSREMQVCEFVWKHPELAFDTEDPEAKAKVAAETGGFAFAFGPDVQPQDINDAYEEFIGMGNKRQMYLDRHHKNKKRKIADSENRLNELEKNLFSKFKGLSEKDIAYIKAYKGPGIDELIERMGDGIREEV